MKIFKDKNFIDSLILISAGVLALIGLIISFQKTFESLGDVPDKKFIILFFDKFTFLTIQTNIFLVVFVCLYLFKTFSKKSFEFKYKIQVEFALLNFLFLIFIIYFGEAIPVLSSEQIKNMQPFTWFYQLCLHLFGLVLFSIYFGLNIKKYKDVNILKLILIQMLYLVCWLILIESIAYIKFYLFDYTGWFSLTNPSSYVPYEIVDPIQNSWLGVSRFASIPLFVIIAFATLSIVPITYKVLESRINRK